MHHISLKKGEKRRKKKRLKHPTLMFKINMYCIKHERSLNGRLLIKIQRGLPTPPAISIAQA